MDIWQALSQQSVITILTTAVPIFVMICTLVFQGIRAKREAKASKDRFETELERSKEHHEEQIYYLQESNRISQLPYLVLGRNIVVGERCGCLTFRLTLTNKGNGVAFAVAVKHHDDESGLPFVDKTTIGSETTRYRYTDFLSGNVVMVNTSAEFEILQDIACIPPNDTKVPAYSVRFEVSFKDSCNNRYAQQFMFQHQGSQIGRVESYEPALLESANIVRKQSTGDDVKNPSA